MCLCGLALTFDFIFTPRYLLIGHKSEEESAFVQLYSLNDSTERLLFFVKHRFFLTKTWDLLMHSCRERSCQQRQPHRSHLLNTSSVLTHQSFCLCLNTWWSEECCKTEATPSSGQSRAFYSLVAAEPTFHGSRTNTQNRSLARRHTGRNRDSQVLLIGPSGAAWSCRPEPEIVLVQSGPDVGGDFMPDPSGFLLTMNNWVRIFSILSTRLR